MHSILKSNTKTHIELEPDRRAMVFYHKYPLNPSLDK